MTKSQQKRIYRAALALRRMQDAYRVKKPGYAEALKQHASANAAQAAGAALTADDLAELERVVNNKQ